MVKQVLVVDDEIGAHKLIGIMLLRGGYKPLFAKDADRAFAMLDQYTPDMIILDVMMPEIDGIELCGMIRQRMDCKGIPIVILSARGDAESVMRGMEAGANDYLPKPILHHDLIAKVQSVIGPGTTLQPQEQEKALQFIGEWYRESPEVALPVLRQQPRNLWSHTIIGALEGTDKAICGRAVIALAAWQRESNAPYTATTGQQKFWEHIRHSLASYDADGAIERWEKLHPVARALMYPADEIAVKLRDCLKDEDQECHLWVMRILLENRDVSVVDIAAQELSNPDHEIRALAALVLAQMGKPQHVPQLVHALNDQEPGVRERAADALASIGGEMALLGLQTALQRGKAEVAEAAANALAELGGEDAVTALIEAVKARSELPVLRQIAHALGKIGGERSNAALTTLAQHSDSELRSIANAYLKQT